MLKVLSGLRRDIEVRRVFEAFEEASKSSKRHQRASRGIEDFEGGFEGFEGVSHDTSLLQINPHPGALIASSCRDLEGGVIVMGHPFEASLNPSTALRQPAQDL